MTPQPAHTPLPALRQEVVVIDVRMPFGSMIVFMVKWAIASIPAVLMLVFMTLLFWTLLLGLFASLLGIGRKIAATPTTSTQSPRSDEAAEYISHVSLNNMRIGDSLHSPAVFGEIKNEGARTLQRVEITISCLGKDGRSVFEKTDEPIRHQRVYSDDPLKPGFSRAFTTRLNDAPSDWTKKVNIKVSQVEFQ